MLEAPLGCVLDLVRLVWCEKANEITRRWFKIISRFEHVWIVFK